MQVPTEQVIAAIIAVTGFAGYVVRFFLQLFKEHVNKQSETLTVLLQEHRTHDKLSAEAHGYSTEALKDISTTLKSLNGNGAKGGAK